MRAALISRLLTPLFIHKARRVAMTHKRKEISRHRRRTIIIDGDLFSFRAKKVDSSFRCSIPRDKGLRTSDHIPRSSISHCGTPGRLLGDIPPGPGSHDEDAEA